MVQGDEIEFDDAPVPETKKKKEELPTSWKCLECNVVHKGPPALICFSCGKQNLGEIDRLRRQFEKKEAEEMGHLMSKVYPSYYHHVENNLDLDTSYLNTCLEELFKKVQIPTKAENADEHKALTFCQILLEDFDDGEHQKMEMTGGCQHAMCCKSCLKMYCENQIEDGEDIVPWIVCPAENCTAPIPLEVLKKANLSNKHLFDFVTTVLGKKLLRNDNWIECCNEKCRYGFMEYNSFKGKKEVTCEVCYTEQKITRESGADEGFYEMVKAGTIRMCPLCQHPTMKDKGMCNVLQCGKCSIWWNWQSKEYSKRAGELKAKARQTGTLWMPGELAYQQNLERTDIEAFKKLLARNGIKYDPNYRRGGR